MIRTHAGYEAPAIPAAIGLRVLMVVHDTRFMDQRGTAEANARRFEVLETIT